MNIKWFSVVRIIGMLMVLLYHFFPSIFSGGFLGVDVFLTLSGFLVTATFLDEYEQTKGVDLLAFFRRRLYRLLPTLLVMIGVVLPYTLVIRSDFRAGIGSQIAAAIAFVTNYFEVAQGGSYENRFVPHLFVHTWALGMEVQLYLLWGTLTWLLTLIARSKEQLRAFLFGLSSLFFAVFFGQLLWSSFNSPNLSSVYYATGKHGFTFFVGVILATFTGIKQTTSLFRQLVKSLDLKRLFGIIGLSVGMLMVLMVTLRFDNLWTYWIGFLLASLASLALIGAMRVLHEKTPMVKEPVFLKFLANISYGIYLFHWPFLIIFSEIMPKSAAIGLVLILSLAFANLASYILDPLLRGKPVQVMGVSLNLNSLKVPLIAVVGFWVFLVVGISLFSPRIGALEQDLMLKGLDQAQSKLTRTRQLVDNQVASDYGVSEGTIVIGDSVALRASEGLTAAIENSVVEGEVSRTLEGAYALLQETLKNGDLPQDVVIAAGTNPISDYEEVLGKIVKAIPQGHRLILVTPYDGRIAGNPEATVNLTRSYELKLAEQYDWITIADWYKVASSSPQIWHYTDYVHFGSDSESIQEGQAIYAKTVKQALEQAQKSRVKLAANKP